ncbi:MAG: V-type ATPase subunit [Lachnospiraceae bacterium]|nr:V-type ATPase subunit [Lachnospiraceae bacterium]
MKNIITYGGIITKTKAMEAKLLKESQFKEISNLQSVPQLIAYLKEKTAYADVLENLTEEHFHRGDIEKIMTLTLYDDFAKLYRFASLEIRTFLKLYLRHYEVDLINYCLRIVMNHYQEPFDLEYKKPFFDRYSSLSIDKLISARTTEQLIDNLKGTEYYSTLKTLKDKGNTTLFDYDLALTLYCYATAWRARSKVFKIKDKTRFTKEWGTKIDLLNLEWIYRAKKYYQMSPVDIYTIIVPNHYRISMAQMKAIVEAPTLDDCIKAIKETKYGHPFDAEQKQILEHMYTEILYRLYISSQRKDPYSIATINAYLYRKEQELNKLTTAMECIRYNLNPNETLAWIT